MFKIFKEFDKKYSTLFFCISLLIIIIFLAYTSSFIKVENNTCVIPNKLVDNYSNYKYDVTYKTNDKKIELFIKRYDKKYLIEKNENGVKSSYYIYYTDIFEEASNGDYIKYRKENIIDGIDNKLLLLDYINDISLESSLKEDNELTCYVNRKLELNMCINLDDSIELEGTDYKIVYEIKEAGTVKDFNVDIDLDYKEDATEEIIDNNTEEEINNSYKEQY